MKIDVISDVTCPWCRMGLTNLKKATDEITAEKGTMFEIGLHPFLLDPIRAEDHGQGFRERFVKTKGISEQQMTDMFAQVTKVGEGYGIPFHFDRIEKAIDTVPIHALMEQVPKEHQLDVMLAIQKAYFEAGKDVGDIDMLLEIVRETGLIAGDDLTVMGDKVRSGGLNAVVVGKVRANQVNGVTSVPFTILNGRLAVPGGQPPEIFKDAIRQAEEMGAAPETTSDQPVD